MPLATKYGGSVPRYTSYPTAPHFTPEVDVRRYGEWLSMIQPDDQLSLYLHIPFCKEMCWYCGCFTKIVNRYEPVSRYVDALIAEIDIVANKLEHQVPVNFIHWGGGSPTILDSNDWRRIFDRLRAGFAVSNSADIAVELDPRTTTQDYVKALADYGVNRVSIGVQDFDKKVQRAINRMQPYDVTKQVVDWLRDAGINMLNLDLMYGLPYQTIELIEEMTAKALSLSPTRIALFGYAHVPWMKAHQRLINEDALPDIQLRWRQAERAAQILKSAGYIRIGFDHFAHPDDPLASPGAGAIKRNFQGYTTDNAEHLIGFGASAISTLEQGYVQNVPSLKSYYERIANGELPVVKGVELSVEDKLRRSIIERLMCDMHVDVEAACLNFGFDAGFLDAELLNLAPLSNDGLIDAHNREVKVTEIGRPLVRQIAAVFDGYLETPHGRHSSGI